MPLKRVITVIDSFRQTSSRGGFIHHFFLTVQIRHLLAHNCVLPPLESNITSVVVPPSQGRNLVKAENMGKSKHTHRTASVSSVGQDLLISVRIQCCPKCPQK